MINIAVFWWLKMTVTAFQVTGVNTLTSATETDRVTESAKRTGWTELGCGNAVKKLQSQSIGHRIDRAWVQLPREVPVISYPALGTLMWAFIRDSGLLPHSDLDPYYWGRNIW